MALATLDGVPFRINPSAIQWGFQIQTAVEDTIGGRVVQVVGATLSDITVTGDYGERKGYAKDTHHNGLELHGPGLLSWELAEAFLKRVEAMMDKQSSDATKQGKMHPPLDFKFPEFGWHFAVYVKSIDDGQGSQAINHTVGNFAYKYRIVLFIVEDRSTLLHQVTNSTGHDIIAKKRADAIKGYISRISHGVGWRKTQFNDPGLVQDAKTGKVTRQAVIAANQGSDGGTSSGTDASSTNGSPSTLEPTP